MIFEDRIQNNPRLLRLLDPRTNEIVDFEIQDLEPEEILQEGTEINAEFLNSLLTFSIEEKQIGYWKDGKPVYMVVKTVTLSNASSWTNLVQIPNLKKAIAIWLVGDYAIHPRYESSDYYANFLVEGTWIKQKSKGQAGTYDLVVLYTKTTD